MINWTELESFLTEEVPVRKKTPTITILTGASGAAMINHSILVEDTVESLELMKKKNKIDSDTADNLTSMLRSPDKENFNLALLAIEQLKK